MEFEPGREDNQLHIAAQNTDPLPIEMLQYRHSKPEDLLALDEEMYRYHNKMTAGRMRAILAKSRACHIKVYHWDTLLDAIKEGVAYGLAGFRLIRNQFRGIEIDSRKRILDVPAPPQNTPFPPSRPHTKKRQFAQPELNVTDDTLFK